ncbi:hypothetical protein M378DRAFT_173143 [Amanita muscaria Koide BX008]|uniref:Uncharacterized protein n=1 Tax=Amanita muscaria (strain Koide BX008) TaxID=946122 RepID=A0A0C2SPL6_AMAMK|nr:hypothetical protein M378DRAFT_173143 [Amanita muscaria Koide BX008]
MPPLLLSASTPHRHVTLPKERATVWVTVTETGSAALKALNTCTDSVHDSVLLFHQHSHHY